MKKRVLSTMLALVLVLTFGFITAIPVAANGEYEVFIKVRGEYTFSELDGAVARATLNMDSVSDSCFVKLKFHGWVFWPDGEGQWIRGIYSEFALDSCVIDGSTITLSAEPADWYLIPSGDYIGTEPQDPLIGTINGNKVTFPMADPNWTDLTGTIRIK